MTCNNGTDWTERATVALREKQNVVEALQTKLAGTVAALEAAEARVAELARKNEGLGRAKDKFASRAYLAEAALDQARGLLKEAHHYQNRMPRDFVTRSAAWLRANPEPATPAAARDARLQAQGFEPVSEERREQNRLVNLGQATPAVMARGPITAQHCASSPRATPAKGNG